MRLALVALLGLALVGSACTSRASACGSDSTYSWAGVQPAPRTPGIAATISLDSAVTSGQTVAWVGVGGYGLAQHNKDGWLQAGLVALPNVPGLTLYYELVLPGRTPVFRDIEQLPNGTSARVAVAQLPKSGRWIVITDQAVAGPFDLRLKPQTNAMLTAESVNSCNHLRASFSSVRTLDARGFWNRFRVDYRFKYGSGWMLRATGQEFLVSR